MCEITQDELFSIFKSEHFLRVITKYFTFLKLFHKKFKIFNDPKTINTDYMLLIQHITQSSRHTSGINFKSFKFHIESCIFKKPIVNA